MHLAFIQPSFSLPYWVISFSYPKIIHLNDTTVKVFVSNWKILALLWRGDYHVPFFTWFSSDVVSYAWSFKCCIYILTVVYCVTYNFYLCCQTILIWLLYQVCFWTLVVFNFSLGGLIWSCCFPDWIRKFESSLSLIPNWTVIIRPSRRFSVGFIEYFSKDVPFLIVRVIKHVVFDALSCEGNPKGFALGNGIIDGFDTIIWTANWGNEPLWRGALYEVG